MNLGVPEHVHGLKQQKFVPINLIDFTVQGPLLTELEYCSSILIGQLYHFKVAKFNCSVRRAPDS